MTNRSADRQALSIRRLTGISEPAPTVAECAETSMRPSRCQLLSANGPAEAELCGARPGFRIVACWGASTRLPLLFARASERKPRRVVDRPAPVLSRDRRRGESESEAQRWPRWSAVVVIGRRR